MVKRPPRPRPPRSENSVSSRDNREISQRQIPRRESVVEPEPKDVAVTSSAVRQREVIAESSEKVENHQSVPKSNAIEGKLESAYQVAISKVRGLLGKIHRDSDSPIESAESEKEEVIPLDESVTEEVSPLDEAETVRLSISGDNLESVPDPLTKAKSAAGLTWLLGSRRAKANLPDNSSTSTTVSLQPLLQEKQKSERRRLWTIIGMSTISLLLVVFIGLSLFVLPVFTLKSSGIKVVGVEGEQQQKIVADSQRFVGKPILGWWTSQLKSVLLKNEWVKDAEISRNFPSSATIKVYPRVPALAVKRGSELVAYDEDATELKFADATQLKLPILEVKADGEDFKRSILNTDAIMNELPQDLREKIRQYTALSPTNIQFTLNNGAVVKWGAREDSKLKARVLQVLLQVPAKVYDVTSPTAPVTS